MLSIDYWAIAQVEGGFRGELAGSKNQPTGLAGCELPIGLDADATLHTVTDQRSGRRNFAVLKDGRLAAALFTSPDPVLVSRQWAATLLSEHDLDASTVLAGRPVPTGPTPARLFAPASRWVSTPSQRPSGSRAARRIEAVGAATRAGTNCGSCRAEIRGIIDAHRLAAAE